MNPHNRHDPTARPCLRNSVKLPTLLLLVHLLLTACTINIHLPSHYLPSTPEQTGDSDEDVLQIRTSRNGVPKSPLRNGETFELEIRVAVEAFVHCYYKQSDGDILRLFPNRFAKNSLVAANELLSIPTSEQFELIASTAELRETVMCLAAHENLEQKLPPALSNSGFDPLPIRNFDELYVIYRGLTTSPLVGRVITIVVD